MSGYINVSIVPFCLNSLTMRALCGLALSFIMIGLSANGWLSKLGTTCAFSMLSWYATPLRLLCKICKSNLQIKEKHPQTVTPPPPNVVAPITFLSWNAVFLCNQTRTRLSTECNKNLLSSDQWPRFQLRIFQQRWSRDQFYRTRRWSYDS